MPDGMEWLAENLAYNQSGSVFYNNDPALGAIYGRLYTWQQAMDAVPEGWRLPSDEDWGYLETTIGSEPGTKIKAKTGWRDYNNYSVGNGTDEFGFTALPGGFYENMINIFMAEGHHGYWWSTFLIPEAPIYVLFYGLSWDQTFLGYGILQLLDRASVRLIREPQKQSRPIPSNWDVYCKELVSNN
jgi:uncharacterized protein (TIGR02145 family)